MDVVAWRAANVLAGNPHNAACVEIALGGAEFEAKRACTVAIAGALSASRDNAPLPPWSSFFLRAGQRLRISEGDGARAYLAITGGIGLLPPLGVRWLRDGDCLSALRSADWTRQAGRLLCNPFTYHRRLRFLPGPHADRFDLAAFCAQPWRVSPTSNRMGLRLQGQPLHARASAEVRTLPVLPGTIQVPPDGLPIVLMMDSQPTGGYPVLGNVLQADLPHAAQLRPGVEVRFEQVNMAQAVTALATHPPRLYVMELDGDWLAERMQA